MEGNTRRKLRAPHAYDCLFSISTEPCRTSAPYQPQQQASPSSTTIVGGNSQKQRGGKKKEEKKRGKGSPMTEPHQLVSPKCPLVEIREAGAVHG